MAHASACRCRLQPAVLRRLRSSAASTATKGSPVKNIFWPLTSRPGQQLTGYLDSILTAMFIAGVLLVVLGSILALDSRAPRRAGSGRSFRAARVARRRSADGLLLKDTPAN
jgi:hypothetical protein